MKIKVEFEEQFQPGSIITTDPIKGMLYLVLDDLKLKPVVPEGKSCEIEAKEFLPGVEFYKVNDMFTGNYHLDNKVYISKIK